MKNEDNVNVLTNEERMCLDVLQDMVKCRSLSYGFHDDSICIEKGKGGWHTYFVDRGQIFNWQNYSSVYISSLFVLKEVAESNEEYKKLIGIFIKRIAEARNKRNDELSAELKKIKVERLIELEESLEDGNCLDNLTDIEIYCMNLASKIPLVDFLEDREKYLKHWFLTDEIKYTQELMERYSCTKEEYFDRCYTANKIRRYKEKKNSSILKEQKRMIKVLNRKNR